MSRMWKQGLLALPSIGVSILPKLACPACWPAYAALLTSIGLGFLISAAYLLPFTTGFLLLAVGAMACRADERRGYGPFLFGLLAASAVLLGKFVWESKLTMYGALGLLVLASFWNSWPRRNALTEAPTCPECTSHEVR